MMEFDATKGEQLRDISLEQVERAADEAWMAAAWAAVLWACELRPGGEFTTDLIWWRLNKLGTVPPREPRALGPVILKAARLGLIERTDRTALTTRPQAHRGLVRVWRVR